MIFSKFSKPKWQHRNPDIRKSAVEGLTDPAILSHIAQNDDAASVRMVAVRKVVDLELLDFIIHRDEHEGVRELARQRYRQIISGQKEHCPPLTIRLPIVQKSTDIELLEFIATEGKEPELRLAAIEKVEREGLLGDIAIKDNNSQIRWLSVQKLTQKSTLERVYKILRNRDKRVSRFVKEKLDKLVEEQERPAKVRSEGEAICKRLEILTRHSEQQHSWEKDYSEFQRLEERWQVVVPEMEETLKNRYLALQQTFITALGNYQKVQEELRQREQALAPLRAAKRGFCEEADKLLANLQDRETITSEEEETLTQHLTLLQREWESTSALDDAVEEKQWQTHFERTYQAISKRQQTLKAVQHLIARLETICTQGDGLLSRHPELKTSHIKELKTQWDAIVQPLKKPEVIKVLNKRFADLLQALENRIHVQNHEREQAVQTLKQLLKEIEGALEKGELHTALPLEQQAKDIFSKFKELSSERYKNLETRLQNLSSSIRELRGWQRWGDNLEREKLCEQVENLISRPDDDPEEMARLIREAQQQWKSLGTSGYSHALWDRFNNACRVAYKPCQEYFATKAKEREENLVKRQSLCERAETFANQIDWKNPDWKAIYQSMRDIEKQWINIGPTNRKVRKQLKTRFDKAMQPIYTYLSEEQRRNRQHREVLIEKAKSALSITGINDAIEEVKRLQHQWHVTVPGARREERQLWKTFRTTCDLVFDRRKQQQAEKLKEQQTLLDAKATLCEQVEALSQLSDDTVRTIPAQLKKLQHQWNEVSHSGFTKRSTDQIEKRFYTAVRQAEKTYQGYLMVEQRQQLDLLQQKAQLCSQMEGLNQSETLQHQLTELQTYWANLPTLQNSQWETTIQQRFQKAVDCILNDKKQSLDEMRVNREILCIRMEIAAGIDSPPETMNARMAYQVSRLSEVMSGGEAKGMDKMAEVQEVEQTWYLMGALFSEQGLQLDQRFKHALEIAWRQLKQE